MHFTEYDVRIAAYAVVVDEAEQILLTWWNGEGRGEPGWSLPGGGVEFEETLEEGLVREVHEETGYDVTVGEVITTHSWTNLGSAVSPRPFRAQRIVYGATITGGTLGTLEVGGSTDHAAWLPLSEVAAQPSRAQVVDLGVAAWAARRR